MYLVLLNNDHKKKQQILIISSQTIQAQHLKTAFDE